MGAGRVPAFAITKIISLVLFAYEDASAVDLWCHGYRRGGLLSFLRNNPSSVRQILYSKKDIFRMSFCFTIGASEFSCGMQRGTLHSKAFVARVPGRYRSCDNYTVLDNPSYSTVPGDLSFGEPTPTVQYRTLRYISLGMIAL